MTSRAEASPTLSQGLSLWYTVCPVPSGSSIGLARGDFDLAFQNTGITLSNIRTHAERRVRETHFNHGHPNSFREGGSIPPIWARAGGQDIRVLGLSWLDRVDQIITHNDSDITEVGHLAGRRLGLVVRPNDQVDFDKAQQLNAYQGTLATAGLSLSDVELVEIAIQKPLVASKPLARTLSRSGYGIAERLRAKGQAFDDLLRGRVDALFCGVHQYPMHLALGTRTLFDRTAHLPRAQRVSGSGPLVLTVRGELLRDAPHAVDAYAAQVIRSARWARRNPAEAIRWLARNSSLAEEMVPLAYNPDVAQALEPSLDPALIQLLEVQKTLLLQQGVIQTDFSVQDWVAQGPLERARAIVDAEEAQVLRSRQPGAAMR